MLVDFYGKIIHHAKLISNFFSIDCVMVSQIENIFFSLWLEKYYFVTSKLLLSSKYAGCVCLYAMDNILNGRINAIHHFLCQNLASDCIKSIAV